MTPNDLTNLIVWSVMDDAEHTITDGVMTGIHNRTEIGDAVNEGGSGDGGRVDEFTLDQRQVLHSEPDFDALYHYQNTDDQFVEVPGITIACMVRRREIVAEGGNQYIVRIERGGLNSGVRMELSHDGEGQLKAGGRRLDSDSFVSVGSPEAYGDEWIAVVACNNYAEGTASLWVDGELVVQEEIFSTGVTDDSSGHGGWGVGLGRGESGLNPNDNYVIAELIVAAEAVDNDQGAALSAYLQDQWFNLPLTPEEEFEATYADASGRDPFPSAVITRTDARSLANTNVNFYRWHPRLVSRPAHILLGEHSLTRPGGLIWHYDPEDPPFKRGRWALTLGRDGDARPGVRQILMVIADNPDSFVPPEGWTPE